MYWFRFMKYLLSIGHIRPITGGSLGLAYIFCMYCGASDITLEISGPVRTSIFCS